MLDIVMLALEAARATVVLGLFLTSAFWLAELGNETGLASRATAALVRASRGRAWAIYALVCATCAVLTATVSLDGAVVLMAPVVCELRARSERLASTLVLGTIGVANAFSLALPEGNPTNVVVAARLGLSPADFVARAALPALLATAICAVVPALVRREGLGSRIAALDHERLPFSAGERRATAALVLAGAGELAAPWLGIAPWWPLCAVATVAFVVTRGGAPALSIPWRLTRTIGCLTVVSAICSVAIPRWQATSTITLLAVALVASGLATAINNLPASVLLSGILGSAGPAAFAALAGLTVGALATPRGSVATIVALQRTGSHAGRGYVRLWAPTALAATAAAVFLTQLR
jgi:arsenical pump membrane protein